MLPTSTARMKYEGPMLLDPDVCYAALRARDRRFDGRFFVAVRTTKIYCRPICPAPTPKRQNVEFFSCSAAAQAAGFRPCRRCRPETSPGTPAWNGTSAVVTRALRLIDDGGLDEEGAPSLAARVGLGERQLRRLFLHHLGASPTEIAQVRRVHFAKRLLDESRLPIAEVALAAGFRSVRQFHHAVRQAFGRSPSEIRTRLRAARGEAPATDRSDALALRLHSRPPFDWQALLEFFRFRATPGVEAVDGSTYRRTIEWEGVAGILEVSPLTGAAGLSLRIAQPFARHLVPIVARVRRMFDLDADPLSIAGALVDDPVLAAYVRARPGLRVPGAWDEFELAVRAILGQQVSVRAATTMAGRMAGRFGRPLPDSPQGLGRLFPRPETLAGADLTGIGLTRARAETIRSFAAAVATGKVLLRPSQGLDDAVASLVALPGIGAWTAQYVALRAFGEPDAFPAGDLGLRRAIGNGAGPATPNELEELAERWRPWRAYAAIHLWTGLGDDQGIARA